MKRVLGLILLCASACFAQLPMGGVTVQVSAGGGNFTLAHTNGCSIANTASTCNATVTALTAGDLHVYWCFSSNNNAGGISQGLTRLSSVSTGETLIAAPGVSTGAFANSGTANQKTVYYVLPPNSLSSSTTLTFTLNQASNGSTTNCGYAEFTPSANPTSVGLDDDIAYQPAAATANPVMPNLTCTGTSNDAAIQFYQSISTFNVYATAVSAPYSTNSSLGSSGNSYGYGIAVPANCNGPTWTATSATPLLGALMFGYNVTPPLEQMYEGFEGGTAGNAPAVADLVSGMKGWIGGKWTVTVAHMLYATAASSPLLNNSGRFADGSSVTAGSGTLGVQITGTGSAEQNSLVYSWQDNNSQQNMVWSFKENDNLVASDTSDIDCGNIHGITDFAGANCYGAGGTRFLRLETPQGNGSSINLPGGTCSGNCPVTIQLQYFGGSGAVTATSVGASVSASVATFTGTFTASQWPTGFAFSPTACTGGTNYNAQLFYVTSANSSTVTASSTGYTNGSTSAVASGTATGCTLTGQHVMSAFNSSGALIGVSFHAGSTSADYPATCDFGPPSAMALTSAKTMNLDSGMLSLTPTIPVQ